MNQLKGIVNNLEPLNNNEFSELFAIATPKEFKKNDCFIHQGEICQYSAFIEKRHFSTLHD